MDYKLLLKKYIEWVGQCDGDTYTRGEKPNFASMPFTDEEWLELQRAARESDDEMQVAFDAERLVSR